MEPGFFIFKNLVFIFVKVKYLSYITFNKEKIYNVSYCIKDKQLIAKKKP